MSQDDEDLKLARKAIDGDAAAFLRVMDRRIARAIGLVDPEAVGRIEHFATLLREVSTPREDAAARVRRMLDLVQELVPFSQDPAPEPQLAHRPCARCAHPWLAHESLTIDQSGMYQARCGRPCTCQLYVDPDTHCEHGVPLSARCSYGCPENDES